MSTVRLLFQSVKTELQNKVGTLTGISQSDMMHRYLRMDKADDLLKRDEATFYSKVWPELENMRKRDKKIQTFERLTFGQYIPVWQLK